jgi:hypothetical protein
MTYPVSIGKKDEAGGISQWKSSLCRVSISTLFSYKKIIFHTATYSQCDVFGKRTKIQKGISGKGAEIHGVEKKWKNSESDLVSNIKRQWCIKGFF